MQLLFACWLFTLLTVTVADGGLQSAFDKLASDLLRGRPGGSSSSISGKWTVQVQSSSGKPTGSLSSATPNAWLTGSKIVPVKLATKKDAVSETPGASVGATPGQKPNVIIFVADDLGHADVSFTQGNLQTPTPNIDKLAWEGIILNRHYVNPICSPTRAALLTGKYTFHIGMQTHAIGEAEPWGLPTQFPTMADKFREIGYSTWHLGKWHIGRYTRAYLPNARGFDYSYGVTGGACNWFNYTVGWFTRNVKAGDQFPQPVSGRDLRENGRKVDYNVTNNVYFPELLNNQAERLIHNQDPAKPFFLYFATPVAHTGFEPYQDSQHTMPQFQLRPPVFQFSNAYPERKKCIGIIQVLDEQFRRIVMAVVNKGVVNNTIFVFFSDNGGPLARHAAFVHGSNHASNWPLRGGKGTLLEGGVRVPAFIWSPLLKRRGRATDQLFHVTDWLPTLWEAVGADPALLPEKGDGFSHWKSFQDGSSVGPRKELVNNIDTLGRMYAMIMEDEFGHLYKLIGGNVFENNWAGWDITEGTVPGDPSWKTYSPVEVNCNAPEGIEITKCVPWKADCLFELREDPCELNNLAKSNPDMLKTLQAKLKVYKATSIPAVIKHQDPAGLEEKWDHWWVPWKDLDPLDKIPLTYQPFQNSSAM
ncbi:Arylsulfatase I [Hypsibius exemplaris]|uniref:Arylsulfatase I n=1 Tax=Hypsibius exemplaris TaxID=2072580 RepID=A0A1W0WQ56_HYPEX|nr:Arylsulfatase I [Hypsibius exemplaris]